MYENMLSYGLFDRVKGARRSFLKKFLENFQKGFKFIKCQNKSNFDALFWPSTLKTVFLFFKKIEVQTMYIYMIDLVSAVIEDKNKGSYGPLKRR